MKAAVATTIEQPTERRQRLGDDDKVVAMPRQNFLERNRVRSVYLLPYRKVCVCVCMCMNSN